MKTQKMVGYLGDSVALALSYAGDHHAFKLSVIVEIDLRI